MNNGLIKQLIACEECMKWVSACSVEDSVLSDKQYMSKIDEKRKCEKNCPPGSFNIYDKHNNGICVDDVS
jgi:hypothetical protein